LINFSFFSMVASLVRVHQTCNLLKNLFDSFENFLLRLVDFQFDRIEYYKHSSLKTTERKDLNLKKREILKVLVFQVVSLSFFMV
jgi:hypothetical protein